MTLEQVLQILGETAASAVSLFGSGALIAIGLDKAI